MYEVIVVNEDGVRIRREFVSEFLYRKYLNRVKRSKKLQVVSYGKC